MVRPRRFPSLSAIRAFEAAARLGSFARAAAELDTSAASVSYHVRRLEAQIGAPLFVRSANRVALTAPGEIVAREAIDAFAALRASFVRAAEIDQSRLSLTTLPSLGTSWLTPRLGRFHERHPEVSLELDLSADAEDLAGGRFDAAIRNGHAGWPGLHATELFPSVFMPLCAPALTAAARGLAEPAQALEVPLIGRRDWWALWFRALGRARAMPAGSFAMQLSAEYLDMSAAIAGQGIAIGSPILFRDEIDAGRLVPAHGLVASDGRAFWFACPAARQHSAKIACFRQWVCDEAAAAREAARGYLRAVAPGP